MSTLKRIFYIVRVKLNLTWKIVYILYLIYIDDGEFLGIKHNTYISTITSLQVFVSKNGYIFFIIINS